MRRERPGLRSQESGTFHRVLAHPACARRDDGGLATTDTDTSQPVKRGRGRPPGSKNKPKPDNEAEIIAAGGLPPIAVTDKEACRLLRIGLTTLRDLQKREEIEVYFDGPARKRNVYRSLIAYADRKTAETKAQAAARAARGERGVYPNLRGHGSRQPESDK